MVRLIATDSCYSFFHQKEERLHWLQARLQSTLKHFCCDFNVHSLLIFVHFPAISESMPCCVVPSGSGTPKAHLRYEGLQPLQSNSVVTTGKFLTRHCQRFAVRLMNIGKGLKTEVLQVKRSKCIEMIQTVDAQIV